MSGDTYPQAILGVRRWRCDYGALRPFTYQARPWSPGEHIFHCDYGHSEPSAECECGLYALYPPRKRERWPGWIQRRLMMSGPDDVLGVILARGAVQMHVGGFRAERAEVVALLATAPHVEDYHPGLDHSLSSAYGVPVFQTAEELTDWVWSSDELRESLPPREAIPDRSLGWLWAQSLFALFAIWLISSLVSLPILLLMSGVGLVSSWILIPVALSFFAALWIVLSGA